MNHSSQTAKAASAAIDSTAMMIPTVDAVCHWAPEDKSKSHGEKKRTPPRIRFTTSQSRMLDQSSIASSRTDRNRRQPGPVEERHAAVLVPVARGLGGVQ
jgi:hypothetical protein